MRLLLFALLPMVWVAVCGVLIGLLTPIPIFGPAVRSLLARPFGVLQRFVLTLGKLMWIPRSSSYGARIAALEERNVALEARVAELTSCILQSLAIAMETQQRLEDDAGNVSEVRTAS